MSGRIPTASSLALSCFVPVKRRVCSSPGVRAPFVPVSSPKGSITFRKLHRSVCLKRQWRVRRRFSTQQKRLWPSAFCYRAANTGCCLSPAPFTCIALNVCLNARGCTCCLSQSTSRPAASGLGLFATIPPSGCLRRVPLMTAPARCGKCWGV